MSRFFYRAIEVDVCPSCQGMWFDAGELAQMIAPPAKPIISTGRIAAAGAGAAIVAANSAAGAAAQDDGGIMPMSPRRPERPLVLFSRYVNYLANS